MAVIEISIEIPPVGFQLLYFILVGVPSQPSNLKYGISEMWIRFIDLVQILDAPNHNILGFQGSQDSNQLFKPEAHLQNAIF
jgi:hypothetical protein